MLHSDQNLGGGALSPSSGIVGPQGPKEPLVLQAGTLYSSLTGPSVLPGPFAGN